MPTDSTLPFFSLFASLLLPSPLLIASEKADDSTKNQLLKGDITSTSLELGTRPSDETPLFSRLSPSATGVDFVNPILPNHPRAYLYASAMGCGGVTVGDFDSDGLPDLFFTGGPVPSRLFRQTGDLKFKDVTIEAGLLGPESWSTGASMIDIDNDGDLDLYVCNYDAANQLFINRGDGTFIDEAKAYGLDFATAGHTPAFGDLDNDGDLDLYLLTNFFYDPRGLITEPIVGMVDGKPAVLPDFEKFYGITGVTQGAETGRISVLHDSVGQDDILLRNNGNGSFERISPVGALIGKGNSALWWDPNGDGWADLYVANDFKDADHFFQNGGDGSLEDVIKKAVPHTTWFSMGCDSADLDGDGLPDLIVADMSGTNHFKQKVGMGAMSDNAEFLNTAVPRQYMRNTVFLNTGTDRMREVAHMTGLANSDWTWTVRLSDFDNDGRADVLFTNGMAVNLNVSDTIASERALPGETEWAKHQRAGTPQLKEQNLAFKNLGDLRFEDVSKKWGLDHVGMSYGATAADLDRDGDLEIIMANLDETIGIYKNNSADQHRITVELRGTTSNRRGLGATVRVETEAGKQSRYMTLSRGYMASGEAVLHFGLGDQDKIKSISVQWPSGHLQSFENQDANQHFVITEPGGKPKPAEEKVTPTQFTPMASSLTEVRHQEIPFDDYALQPLLPQKISQLGPGMAWGDIDGDGDDDAYFSGAKGSAGKVMRNEGEGKFSTAFVTAANFEDMGAVFFDADGDGDQDLYVVSGGNECAPGDVALRDRLYLNSKKGEFTQAELPDFRDSGGPVAAADFDRDGDLDLFVGGRITPGKYPLAPKSRLLRNDGTGKFADVTDEVAPNLSAIGMVTSALWSDAVGDDRVDLLLTCEWSPPRIFQSKDGKLFEFTQQAGLANHWGWWNGIAGADIDNDGDMDYAISNFGENTKYHASYEKPTRIFYGDFDGSGKESLVEAEYEGKTLYPVRGRSCSSGAMPFLARKFTTYKGFAAASLTDIYTPQKLSQAIQYVATELRSGFLINDGKGKFTFKPMPRIAQIAPGFGMSLADHDGDGNSDLYLVGNFYTPQAETGFMAGGVSLLLKGNGRGDFTPIEPSVSGLIVPGDAKSLTRIDLNGDRRPDFVVGVNDAATMVFENQSSQDFVTIRLVGDKGNPTAIGAKVILGRSGKILGSAEVTAGTGYLSQDPSSLIFGIGGKNDPIEVEVRWPDGTRSTETIAPADGVITIQQKAK